MTEKILIVDDDPDAINALKIFLTRQGYQVAAAKNGMEALRLARSEQPDLIILDVMMPDIDGFEVSRSLHRIPETALIPILMVTARASVDDKVKGYESGADIYLTKPVHSVDLQANIKALIMQRKARKAALTERGYLVGIMAAKGGVGVSTCALNLAITYSKKYGVKAIAAELRPGQGTWADELNLPASSNNLGIDELLKMSQPEITPELVESLLTGTSQGVQLLLASNCYEPPDALYGPGHYEQIVSTLSQLSPMNVLDIGDHFTSALPVILNLINEVIVVVEPQLIPVKQTGRMLDKLRLHNVGTSKPVTIVSLNRTRADTVLSISQIEDILQKPVSLGFPPALELAGQAAKMNVPMCSLQPEGLIAQQYIKLAEIINKHAITA